MRNWQTHSRAERRKTMHTPRSQMDREWATGENDTQCCLMCQMLWHSQFLIYRRVPNMVARKNPSKLNLLKKIQCMSKNRGLCRKKFKIERKNRTIYQVWLLSLLALSVLSVCVRGWFEWQLFSFFSKKFSSKKCKQMLFAYDWFKLLALNYLWSWDWTSLGFIIWTHCIRIVSHIFQPMLFETFCCSARHLYFIL